MTYNSEVLVDIPAGFWPLNETSGSTAFDLSGNGNNGTYIGGVALGTKTLLDGAVCADFNGSSGYVNIGTPAALNFRDVWSIEAWVSTDITGTGEQYIFSEGYSGAPPIYYALCKNIGAITTTGRVGAGEYDSGGWKTIADPTSLAIGTLAHYVVTFDGTTINLYKNGFRVSTGTISLAAGTAYNPVSIGIRNDNGTPYAYWDGGIGRVALYHSVLSDIRVATHYISGGGVMPPTTAKVYHEYSEVVVLTRPTARVYHQYSEGVVLTKPAERNFHQFVEVIASGGAPVRNYHQFAEVICGPVVTSSLVSMGLQGNQKF